MTTALNLELAPKPFAPSLYATPRPFVSKSVAIVAAPVAEAGLAPGATRLEMARLDMARAEAPRFEPSHLPSPVEPSRLEASGMDLMIKSIEQATARMAEVLARRHDMEEAFAQMQAENAGLLARAEAAEAVAARHEAQAAEALLQVEQMGVRNAMQNDEQERLKASVDILIAMFGGAEAMAAGV